MMYIYIYDVYIMYFIEYCLNFFNFFENFQHNNKHYFPLSIKCI